MLKSPVFQLILFVAFNVCQLAYAFCRRGVFQRRLTSLSPIKRRCAATPETTDAQLSQKFTNLITDVWYSIAHPPSLRSDVFFALEDYGLDRSHLEGFINHMQLCKDCSMDEAFLMASENKEGKDAMRVTYVVFPLLSEDEDEDDDSWGNFDPLLLREQESDSNSVFPVENDNEVIVQDVKHWTNKGKTAESTIMLSTIADTN